MCAKEIDLLTKFEILAHTTGPIVYFLFIAGFISFPYIMMHDIDYYYIRVFAVLPSLEFFAAAIVAIYAKSPSATNRKSQIGFWNRTCRIPIIFVFIALQGGMSCFQVKAVLEGLFSKDATFLATPKKGSSNIVKKQIWDDMTALIGVFLGLHRVFFLLTDDIVRRELAGSHLCFTAINVILCVGFFWVNGGFLMEKYKPKKSVQ